MLKIVPASLVNVHVLRHLYHEKEACGYNLRAGPYNFALPAKKETNFVSRSLYAELKTYLRITIYS